MLFHVLQWLIVCGGECRPERLSSERHRVVFIRLQMEHAHRIVHDGAKEIGFILEIVIGRAFAKLRLFEDAIQRSTLVAMRGELLRGDQQQPLAFLLWHLCEPGKRHVAPLLMTVLTLYTGTTYCIMDQMVHSVAERW